MFEIRYRLVRYVLRYQTHRESWIVTAFIILQLMVLNRGFHLRVPVAAHARSTYFYDVLRWYSPPVVTATDSGRKLTPNHTVELSSAPCFIRRNRNIHGCGTNEMGGVRLFEIFNCPTRRSWISWCYCALLIVVVLRLMIRELEVRFRFWNELQDSRIFSNIKRLIQKDLL